jgi:hypothetical protein
MLFQAMYMEEVVLPCWFTVPEFQKIYLWFLSLLFQKDYIFLQNVFPLYHFFIFTGKIPRQNLHWTLNWSLNNEGRKCKAVHVEDSGGKGRENKEGKRH